MPLDEHYRHRWNSEVVGGHNIGWDAEKTASGFARLLVQSGLLLNGGALAALPVLMDKGRIAYNAQVLVLAEMLAAGLLLSVLAGAIGFVSFSLGARARYAEARLSAAHITALATNQAEQRDRAGPERRSKLFRRLATSAAYVGTLVGFASYVLFAIGVFGLIESVKLEP